MIVRSTLLTNSAAEFVENRIDSALGMEISAGAQAEFVPELDRFRSRDGIAEYDPSPYVQQCHLQILIHTAIQR